MRVAIHQPNFAPWLGYFHKFAQCDLFVFLDDAQFSKNGYTNRVRIRGSRWLTIPVSTSLGTPINECLVGNSKFLQRVEGQLRAAYGASAVVEAFLEQVGTVESERLVDVNYVTIDFLARELGVKTASVRASELGVATTGTQRLVDIVRSVDGTSYLSVAVGHSYQDPGLFAQAGIQLEYTDFRHPVYDQGDTDFVPGLSALDFLARPTTKH